MRAPFPMAGLACLALFIALHAAWGQPVSGPDFSKSNSVSLFLADAKRGAAPDGLLHAFWERDGRTEVINVEGTECRSLRLANREAAKGYFYFALDPGFKVQDVSKVRIEVEYFDGAPGQEGVFGLQYDARGSPNGSSSKPLLPNVCLMGSGRWRTNRFHVRDGTFDQGQNARSDFRLWASPPELSVSRVTVTRVADAPLPPPLAFDAAGEAKLTDWNPQWDSGARPSFVRGTNDGIRWLGVRAPSGSSIGSWRTAVLLPVGDYQLMGRARTPDNAGGSVMLRVSGRPRQGIASGPLQWITLTYEFTTLEEEYVELVCEFSGMQASAQFDLDSLKLVRKANARP